MTLLFALDMAGLTAAAMSGALAAGRRSMDWVGVLMLAAVTALGGGSMRDVLLGHYPLSWVAEPWLLGVTSGAALLTLLVARYLHHLKYTFLTLDAVGLVVTTLIGCDVAREMGQPVSIVVLSGMITGCVGGVLRDVLCNQVPLLFSSELYASVSVLVGVIYVGGLGLGIGYEVVTLTAVTAGLTLRLLAVRYGWGTPKFIYTKDWF